MKNILLLSAAIFAGSLTSVNGQAVDLCKPTPSTKQITLNDRKSPSGLFRRDNLRPDLGRNILNPASVSAKAQEETVAPDGCLIFEDFEISDTQAGWLPQGWTANHVKTDPAHSGWLIFSPSEAGEFLTSRAFVYAPFNATTDDWIITPEVTPEDGMILSLDCFNDAPFYFSADTYDNYGYINAENAKVSNDFKILISDDHGASWQLLKSLAQESLDLISSGQAKAMWDLYYLRKIHTLEFDLTDYAGKPVQFAFQVVGEPESATSVLDNVKVGFPNLNLKYSKPSPALYFGLTDQAVYLPGTFLTVPVYEPVKFSNTSKNDGATYSWQYSTSWADNKEVFETSDEQKTLSVTYHTDHSTPASSRNNIYSMPTLIGNADKHMETRFSYPDFLQAGGRGEYEIQYIDDGSREVLSFGLAIADPNTEGTVTYADISVPYFGYNQESDRFWSETVFGEDAGENAWAKLVRIADLFYTSTAPIVIEGVRINAFGKVSRDACFTAEIYLLSPAYEAAETPDYKAVCTGDDIKIIDRSATHTNDIISLNFRFDEPVVISRSDAISYIVAIGGFNDPVNVQYFSPIMSEVSSPTGLGFGWYGTNFSYMGFEVPMSWGSVTRLTKDELVSFYIMLDAEYPWLESDTDEIEINTAQPVYVALDTYFDGSELQFEGMPSWLTAVAAGRYGDGLVKFTALADGSDSANVTITGPGVSKTIKVSQAAESGIGAIDADAIASTDRIYTLTGQTVSGTPSPGVYIVRRANGTVAKTFIR